MNPPSSAPPAQQLEQVWFPGVHSSVGGGGEDTRLSDITLQWIIKRAEDCGLAFNNNALTLNGNPDLKWTEPWSGWYRVLFPKPLARAIAHKERKGLSAESAASTAVERLKTDPDYKPSNLIDYCKDPGHRVTPVWSDHQNTD